MVSEEILAAYRIAMDVHKDQKRRGGEPYILHPLKVGLIVLNMGGSEFYHVLALLHDVLEDTKDLAGTENRIHDKIGNNILNKIQVLTHNKGDSYEEYIQKIKNNPELIKVKVADILHNLTDSPTQKQTEKYINALKILVN